MKEYRVTGDYVALYRDGEYSHFVKATVYIPAASHRQAVERSEKELGKECHGALVRWLYGVESTEVSTAEYLRAQGVTEML